MEVIKKIIILLLPALLVACSEQNDVSFYGGGDMMDESFTYLQKSINFSMTSLFTTGGIRGSKISIDKFLSLIHI